ncbi:MAG: VCBS repeat-containing protein [Acidobacteria bacterium]|nr:VCBS repeat-containing protein [Acidobacteriota bacterium]
MRTLERFRGWNSTMIAFTVVFFGLALLLPVAADLAGLDPAESPATVRNDPGTPTIRAEKRGFPNISLKDGVDLGGHAPGSAPGRRLAAGDFDSDGTADLAIAGSDGGVRILRGNPAAKNSLTDEARGLAAPEPFLSVIAISNAGVTPDFFESGDFNADGHADLLAAAKGESHLILLAGYGNGSLASPQTVPVAGRITALAVGEIGQSDGQTDIAVAVNGKAGARLLVFEHPEGAFKFKPEVLPLASPAADIAVGDLNGDHYSDIAIGGGNTLTIISERGQAYPWDLAPKLGVKRPPALIERRAMPGGVAGLAIGDFSGARGRSLAVLTDDGTIYLLKPSTPKEFRQMLPDSVRGKTVAPWFVPTQTDGKFLGLLPEPVPDPQAAEANGSLMLDARLSPQEKLEAQNKRIETLAKDFAALDSTERDRLKSMSTQAGGLGSDRARKGFLRTISAKPSNLGSWEIDTLVAGVGSGFSAVAKGLSAARVSVSGRDDLLMLDAASGRVKIITQPIGEDGRHGAEVVSLDSDTAPQAVLPMRLNGDALDDLVVLRDGADSPTIVRTTPTLVLIVDTDADSGGVCDGVGPCTLRRAIEIANLNPRHGGRRLDPRNGRTHHRAFFRTPGSSSERNLSRSGHGSEHGSPPR